MDLIKPAKWIKTKMAFAGLRKEKDRTSVNFIFKSKFRQPLQLP